MAALSKVFDEYMRTKTCQTFLMHPESCPVHCLKDIPLYLLSNFKYFAPICLLPLLVKLRHINKKKLRQTLEYYAECSLIGTATGCTINVLICFVRYILGRFTYYSYVYVPSLIGGCMYNLASDRVKDMFETSIFQCNISIFLLQRSNIITRLIANSKHLQTYIFMCCSALILQGKYVYNLKGFWFLQPNNKLVEFGNTENPKCQLHSESSCQQHLWHGMRKYFLLGLTLDLIKTMMNNVDVIKTQSKMWRKIKNFRIRSMALLTSYIGIYRFTHCYLNRKFPHQKNLNHILSGFLSGICYSFYPQSNLFCYALLQSIFTIWNIIRIKNVSSKNQVLKYLLRIPFGKIMFPIGLANIVHYVCLKPEYCSPLVTAIAYGVTNKYPSVIKSEVALMKQTTRCL
ncbi:uncharacterized protein [Musca autumnalis]|uniref:uncharacterized protein n=1 Tax=Musca autumnalis TaxID=221902 RepID=UPI003CEA6529